MEFSDSKIIELLIALLQGVARIEERMEQVLKKQQALGAAAGKIEGLEFRVTALETCAKNKTAVVLSVKHIALAAALSVAGSLFLAWVSNLSDIV